MLNNITSDKRKKDLIEKLWDKTLGFFYSKSRETHDKGMTRIIQEIWKVK